ncbi:hypothetical protein [Pararhizobium sp.]|uniref:hypothetical protein n=1 Tax=Pararhizobium sp. TaxID=1977563 RepID=UPI00271907F1|nr:hypothetical protein [Pararhizobium sp.]MDO9416990.1 hypothetical protein [Pararhizobium sp.]
MFLSRYNDRPSTLKVDHDVETNMEIDLDGLKVTKSRKGTVHSLNEFDITVWADGEVTAKRKYYASTDPGKHFPNMTVSDGAINFPIEDLVSFILDRVTPEELADGIIADDEARAGLVEKMAERWSEPGFDDADRRKFLTKVQQQVHAKSIDRAIERLNARETGERSREDYYRWRAVELGHYKGLYERYTEALYELREAGKLDDAGVQRRKAQHTAPEKLAEYIKENRDPVVSESVGPQWYESRDYWRAELKNYFPEPVVEGDETGGAA